MRPPGPEGAEAARLGHWSFQRMACTEPLALSDLKVYSVFKKKKREVEKGKKYYKPDRFFLTGHQAAIMNYTISTVLWTMLTNRKSSDLPLIINGIMVSRDIKQLEKR